MKSKPTSSEVDKLITDAVATVMRDLPYNAQDQLDQELAEYFVAKRFTKLMKPRVDKYERKAKAGEVASSLVSENYNRTASYGTPRETFDKDAFITAVVEKFKLPKHQLVELATQSTKTSATPISLDVEYIGDVAKAK